MMDEIEQTPDETPEGEPAATPEPVRALEAEDDGVVTSLPRDGLVRGAALTLELLRAEDEDTSDGRLATLVGTLAEYGQWAEIRSEFEGHFMERVMPGSFTRTFAENRARMRVIFDHGLDRFIGRKPLGPLEDVADDGQRIRYRVAMLDTDYNRELLPGLRAGLYGSSWRMDVLKKRDVMRPQRSDYNPEGLPERTIFEMRVAELGPTPFPAYVTTTAGLRSLTDDYLIDRLQGRQAPKAGPGQDQSEPERRRSTFPAISPDEFVRQLSR